MDIAMGEGADGDDDASAERLCATVWGEHSVEGRRWALSLATTGGEAAGAAKRPCAERDGESLIPSRPKRKTQVARRVLTDMRGSAGSGLPLTRVPSLSSLFDTSTPRFVVTGAEGASGGRSTTIFPSAIVFYFFILFFSWVSKVYFQTSSQCGSDDVLRGDAATHAP